MARVLQTKNIVAVIALMAIGISGYSIHRQILKIRAQDEEDAANAPPPPRRVVVRPPAGTGVATSRLSPAQIRDQQLADFEKRRLANDIAEYGPWGIPIVSARRFVGHNEAITEIAWFHDSTRFVSASRDNTLRIWDVASAKTIHLLEAHFKAVRSVSVSQDDSRIASASDDRDVAVWDANTGDMIALVDRYQQMPTLVRFLDRDTLAIGSADGVIRFWSISREKQISTIDAGIWLTIMEPSSDGAYLATRSQDNLVRVWNWRLNAVMRTLKPPTAVGSLAIDRDNIHLRVGCGNRIMEWALPDGVQTLDATTGKSPTNFTFSPDGKFVLYDSGFALMTYPKLEKVMGMGFNFETGNRVCGAISPDGKYAAYGTGGADVGQGWLRAAHNDIITWPIPDYTRPPPVTKP